MKIGAISLLSLLAGLSGCATIVNGSTEMVSVQATDGPAPLDDVQCALNNHSGSWNVTVPGDVTVHRGSEPLEVNCAKPGYAPASESVSGSTSGYVYGNILIGGGIGATVDTVDGSAWKYPKTITVQMQPQQTPAGPAIKPPAA